MIHQRGAGERDRTEGNGMKSHDEWRDFILLNDAKPPEDTSKVYLASIVRLVQADALKTAEDIVRRFQQPNSYAEIAIAQERERLQ